MQNKQSYWTRGSFCLLLFVILGYTVRFYPQNLVAFDSGIQTAVRGNLPTALTTFFTSLTKIGNMPVIMGWVGLATVFLLWKRYYSEAILLVGNLALTGLLVVVLKNIYQRPRPSIEHLIAEKGFSFPSGHALAASLVIGSVLIIVSQNVQAGWLRRFLQGFLILLILALPLSRVYLGVHYPSDVIGSLLLGFGILFLEFPAYQRLRFRWRFTGKQAR